MLEIEQKFRCDDWFPLRARLEALRATAEGRHEEADHYFNAPDRDFAATDEVFRIRRVGPESRLTYKGPKLPGAVKTRTEIEVPLAGPFEVVERFFLALGYKPVAVVRKFREEFALARRGFAMHVCLDEVPKVGRFVEIEIVAPEAERAAADAAVQEVVGILGLTTPEKRSYLRMVLEVAS